MMGLDDIRGGRPSWVLMTPVGDRTGGGPPLYREVDPDDPVGQEFEEILRQPYMQSFLKVGHAYTNYLARRGESVDPPYFALRAPDPRPSVGFGLVSGRGEVEMKPRTHYTMLATGDSQGQFARTEVESILLHEFSHVMLFQLAGLSALARMPRPYTRMHLSTAVSDYTTALSEGWGIHFEVVTRDLTRHLEVRNMASFDPSPDAHFLCDRETRTRLAGVAANAFIHEPLPPGSLTACPSELSERLVYQATHGVGDPGNLRSPQGMLSCEGVVASLFYRLTGDPKVRGTFAEPAFYTDFLPPGMATPDDPAGVFTPRENAYLKVGAAVHAALRSEAGSAVPPIMKLISEYGRLFPAERRRVYRIFLETTAYVTVCDEAHGLYRRLHRLGQLGRLRDLKDAGQEWLTMAEKRLQEALTRDCAHEGLASRLGPEIWLQNDDVSVPEVYWSEEASLPLTFNMNACPAADLMSVPEITGEAARRIVCLRAEKGHFESIAQLINLAGVSRASARSLRHMRDAFLQAPTRYLLS